MESIHNYINSNDEVALKDSMLSFNSQSSINSNISNINLFIKNNKSNISNLSNNWVYPSLKSCIIFYLSETELNNYLKEKEDFICQEMKKGKEKYAAFYLFLDALNNINNKDFVNYRKKINDINKKYFEKKILMMMKMSYKKLINLFLKHYCLIISQY